MHWKAQIAAAGSAKPIGKSELRKKSLRKTHHGATGITPKPTSNRVAHWKYTRRSRDVCGLALAKVSRETTPNS